MDTSQEGINASVLSALEAQTRLGDAVARALESLALSHDAQDARFTALETRVTRLELIVYGLIQSRDEPAAGATVTPIGHSVRA